MTTFQCLDFGGSTQQRTSTLSSAGERADAPLELTRLIMVSAETIMCVCAQRQCTASSLAAH